MRRLALGLGLLLVAQAASAREVTFAWDPGIDWPAGTTVEVCGNGDVCQTGKQPRGEATLNLDVSPGQQVVGQARAKGPDGYSCGDPPTDPCYSEWVYIRKVIPVGVVDVQGEGVRQ
jgi:hypothetical protein